MEKKKRIEGKEIIIEKMKSFLDKKIQLCKEGNIELQDSTKLNLCKVFLLQEYRMNKNQSENFIIMNCKGFEWLFLISLEITPRITGLEVIN